MGETPVVPDGAVRAQFVALVRRPAAGGRPLGALPVLQLGPTSGAWVAAGGEAVVQLDTAVAHLAARERAFPMAHELSHVLRIQEGRRPHWPAAAIAAGPLAALLAFSAAVLPVATGARWPFALIVPALVGLWLLRLALQRSEEGATDRTAAVVFGEVLTLEGVRRITLDEGRFSRWIPGWMRSHDTPRRRRERGLGAVRDARTAGDLSWGDGEQFPLSRLADTGEERSL